MCGTPLPSFSKFGFRSSGHIWPAVYRCGNEGGVPFVQAVRHTAPLLMNSTITRCGFGARFCYVSADEVLVILYRLSQTYAAASRLLHYRHQ